MARALLIVPPFWDPVCVPLGITSLKAYGEANGHQVDVFDFNTVPKVFNVQRAYFDEGERQFPFWKNWFIERNGTEMLALHQILYLFGRRHPRYRELVGEVMNLDQRPAEQFLAQLDVAPFDALFDQLYGAVATRLDALLARSQPDVVGCTVLNPTWPAALFILRRVKERMPHVRTVIGGPGPLMGIASRADEVRTFVDAHDFLDYYVVGEGEEPFLQILEHPDLPRGVLDPQRGLPLEEAKRRSPAVAGLPMPDYGDLEVNRYLQLSVASSRGCPFECSFCAETVFWKGFRKMGAPELYDRLDALAGRHHRASFFVCDSLANQVIGPLTQRIAAAGKPYKVDCYLRADQICTDEKRTRAWREGGLFRARMGMESASQRILDAMVKMTTPESMSRSLHALAAQGIMTSTLWIVNYPGESEAEFDATLRFIRENAAQIYQADAQVFQYHPEGLAHSKEIDAESGSRHRFSADVNAILGVTPYLVERDFSAAAAYDRLERFVATMRELQIPNPYRMFEWLAAEERWRGMGRDSGWAPRQSLVAMNS
jgi:radical SAM superfamily enzyme YgiQ (UPF0313 family)